MMNYSSKNCYLKMFLIGKMWLSSVGSGMVNLELMQKDPGSEEDRYS